MNILFTAGFGYTGSGAVLDLLREVESVHVMNNEFRIIADPDGLLSLRRNITKYWSLYSSDIAIKRFKKLIDVTSGFSFGPYTFLDNSKEFNYQYKYLSYEFIRKLSIGIYRGYWYGNDNLLLRLLYSKFFLGKFKINIYKKLMYMVPQISKSGFDQIAGDYIYTLIANATNKPYFCFDEGFIALYIDELFELLPNCKLILTIRNPKDVIATTKQAGWNANPAKVGQKVEWLFSTYDYWMKKTNSNDLKYNDKIKVIKFEDLVQQYDVVKDEIFEFFCLPINDHRYMNKYFNPNHSIKNIDIWKDFLSREEADLIDKRFEKFNSSYCYK